MEIWNLVFIQEQIDARAARRRARCPAKNVDTGSSLERVAMVLQGVDNVFETDLFRPILEVAERLSGKTARRGPARRRVAQDHGRARPGHDVPHRRRRAAVERGPRVHPAPDAAPRGLARPTAGHRAAACSTRSSTRRRGFGDAYPELRENEAFIRQVAGSEEERFAATLRQGHGAVRGREGPSRRDARISGDDAFELSDTFGVPHRADGGAGRRGGPRGRRGRVRDELLEEQRNARARPRRRCEIGLEAGAAVPPTEFVGYQRADADAPVVAAP